MAGFLACTSVWAKSPDDSVKLMKEELRRIDSIETSLHYKTGKIDLGTASINVPANFKFLEAAEAKHVVEELWGNPPSDKAPLGLLFPASSGATACVRAGLWPEPLPTGSPAWIRRIASALGTASVNERPIVCFRPS